MNRSVDSYILNHALNDIISSTQHLGTVKHFCETLKETLVFEVFKYKDKTYCNVHGEHGNKTSFAIMSVPVTLLQEVIKYGVQNE